MWDIENHSPFPVSGGFQRDQNGRSLWCVWIAAESILRPNRPPLFEPHQTAPRTGPQYDNDDPLGMLISDAEVTLPRDAVDLTVAADGYLIDAHSARDVRASWGSDWQKTATVQPPRSWNWRGKPKLADTLDLDPIPLDWRSSANGVENPLGIPTFFQNRKEARDQFLPQFETVDNAPTYAAPQDPVSMMPIPRGWPQRAQFGGTYDEHWQRTRAPLLPADLSSRYWQAAAPDQVLPRPQVDRLIAQKVPITFEGMTADGLFETLVPHISFQIAVKFQREWHNLDCLAQSLHFDLRTMRLRQVWCAALPIRAAHFDVDVELTHITLDRTESLVVHTDDATRFTDGSLRTEEAL